MKKTSWLLVCAVLMTALVGVASAQTFDLIVGGGSIDGATDVSDVVINVDCAAKTLTVEYILDDGWFLTESHVAVADALAGIPQTKQGNPIPGQFGKKGVEESATLSYQTEYATQPLDISGLTCGQDIIVAVHGVVVDRDGLSGVTGLCAMLPDHVTVRKPTDLQTGNSYFTLAVGGGTWLDGLYDGWCIDADMGAALMRDQDIPAKVYCSYGEIPTGLVEHPENFPLVNWILNQVYIGTSGPTGVPYTTGDVQMAIWALIDDDEGWGEGPTTEANVAQIVADAQLRGAGFVPGCGDYLGIIIAPLDEQGCVVSQIVLIPVRVPCGGGSETIWGALTEKSGECITTLNYPFPGSNWATYLKVPGCTCPA